MILLNKCLEEGNRLFRRSRLQEASEKYREGVERLPDLLTSAGHHFTELRKSLLLNLSRCERRRGWYIVIVLIVIVVIVTIIFRQTVPSHRAGGARYQRR